MAITKNHLWMDLCFTMNMLQRSASFSFAYTVRSLGTFSSAKHAHVHADTTARLASSRPSSFLFPSPSNSYSSRSLTDFLRFLGGSVFYPTRSLSSSSSSSCSASPGTFKILEIDAANGKDPSTSLDLPSERLHAAVHIGKPILLSYTDVAKGALGVSLSPEALQVKILFNLSYIFGNEVY